MKAQAQTTMQRVIVIEDERLTYTLLQHLLERRGFEVTLATDGRQAETLLHEQEPPALILLDLMLPYTDGFELITAIRQRPDWHEVPIIILTAKSHERDVVRALEVGANDYVIKPFLPEELIARVRRFTK